MNLPRLKYLLAHEMDFTPTDQAMDALIALGEPVSYKRGQLIVEEGSNNKYVYILAEGIIAYTDLDGEHERTYALGTPGTTFIPCIRSFSGSPRITA